jgi:hypothetical protein
MIVAKAAVKIMADCVINLELEHSGHGYTWMIAGVSETHSYTDVLANLNNALEDVARSISIERI